jgi:predicted RNase H-like HicB family nuclease
MAPDFPGCVAVAESVEKVRKLMGEAIGLHLDMMRRSGEKIPKPTQQLRIAIDGESDEEFCTWVEAKAPRLARAQVRTKR